MFLNWAYWGRPSLHRSKCGGIPLTASTTVSSPTSPRRGQDCRENWDFHELTFADFRAEAKRALKTEIPLKERADWEALHAEASAEVKRLTAEIGVAEREIDRLVYEAFDLTGEEIALLEKSLEGQV